MYIIKYIFKFYQSAFTGESCLWGIVMTAVIISFFNQKGGCAKTQSTMQIGGELGLRGNKVAIIDMDPQGTATIWSSQADEDTPFPAMVFSLSAVGDKLFREVKKYINDYDFILIDCPPAIESQVPWFALLGSRLAIIPVVPDMGNIWAAGKAKALAVRAMNENEDLKVFFLSSRVGRGKAYAMCLDQVRHDPEIPMLKSQVSDRIAFVEAQALGTCVTESSKNSSAAKEIKAVVDEILSKVA